MFIFSVWWIAGKLVNVSWYCARGIVCWFCVVSCCWGGGGGHCVDLLLVVVSHCIELLLVVVPWWLCSALACIVEKMSAPCVAAFDCFAMFFEVSVRSI